MMLFYRLLFLPGLVLALPYYLFRMWRRGGYRTGFGNRFGLMGEVPSKRKNVKRIWLQAVSVGELIAIRPLLERLDKDPQIEVVLTTTTSTGLRVLKEKLVDLTVWHGIFPMDFWLFSRKAWKRIQPDLVILMEGELWPEHIYQANSRSIPVLLVNARLSDRSYRRHLSFKNLTKRYYSRLDGILAGSETDRERLEELGWVPSSKIHPTGNLKLDVKQEPPPSSTERATALAEFGFHGEELKILLGSSTWADEEESLIHSYLELKEAFPELRLLIVPRHAERQKDLETMVTQLPIHYHFRSFGKQAPEGTEVYFADTTGELGKLTRYADIVFIGKSLPPNSGGQTPVEAAALGKPLLFGPDMSNFRDISRNLIRAGAVAKVHDSGELTSCLRSLLQTPDKARNMGKSSFEYIEASRGATDRVIEHIKSRLA